MTTVSSSEPTPTGHAFERRVEDVKISKMDINSVIMDYLVNEGYPAAALKFAAEANIKTRNDDDKSNAYIEERVQIRNCIYAGEIQIAIEKINDLNPDLLDDSPSLHFSLLRLHLINLIEHQPNNDITEALKFAQTQLASRATTSPDFLEDLERTMALLIYPRDSLTPQLKELLDPELRRKVAEDVNKKLLKAFNREPDAKLRELVRLRAWAEVTTRETGRELPGSLVLFGEASDEGVQERSARNGLGGTGRRAEDMIEDADMDQMQH